MKEMKSTYEKYLQKPTPKMHDDFLHASGIIEYQPTNNYVFQALDVYFRYSHNNER